MSFAREQNVTSIGCKKEQKYSNKKQLLMGIKESPFAGKTLSNKNIFTVLLVVLVPSGCLWRNFQIHFQ
jgi:hypothetical protein